MKTNTNCPRLDFYIVQITFKTLFFPASETSDSLLILLIRLYDKWFSSPSAHSPIRQVVLFSFCSFAYTTSDSLLLLLIRLYDKWFSSHSAHSPIRHVILFSYCSFAYMTSDSLLLLLIRLYDK